MSSSVGVFRKMDMELVYTLTQIDNPTSSGETLAIDNGGDNLPLFLCPLARFNFLKLKIKKDNDTAGAGSGDDDDDVNDDYELLLLNSSPHFPNTSSDQQSMSLLDCNRDGICKVPVVPLFWCNNEVEDYSEFQCGACKGPGLITSYYACLQCKNQFHKECVESPLEIIHPSHPFHSLQLYSWGNRKSVSGMAYRCSTCDVGMDSTKAMMPIPLVKDHPKSHLHPLNFFPTQASLVCHICGLIEKSDPTYICIQCVFVIHQGCIGFPHVIRISRHPHRITFTPSLPRGALSCGVCHLQVDNNYGAYSSSKSEAYFVHSKCALRRKVWDGIDLDGVPEEDDEINDGEPFKRIADGIILHPFHSHNLRLEFQKAYDENKYCRGCSLPIYEGQFYSCVNTECSDFILHESCANAPRMKRHPLHPQPLTLQVVDYYEGEFQCSACYRHCSGFFYNHPDEGLEPFQLDLRCAFITEPFWYQGHKHPLFLVSDPEKERQLCQLCKFQSNVTKLNCLECDYIICFSCLTFPYKARYKHDSHFLTICDGKEASDQVDWCEVCEGKIQEVKERRYQGYRINREELKIERRYYSCNDCSTTLHVECLLGKDIYMKPGETSKEEVSAYMRMQSGYMYRPRGPQVHLNSSLSRPICTKCGQRCLFPIYYKDSKIKSCMYEIEEIFCSWNCKPGCWSDWSD